MRSYTRLVTAVLSLATAAASLSPALSQAAAKVAREILAKDPQVAEAFRKKLAEDPKFAANPQARLDFFYRLSPSWDERLNLYPVYRVAAAP